MKLGRRTFLKLLGLAPVAAPVVIEAVKAAEAYPILGIDPGAGDDVTVGYFQSTPGLREGDIVYYGGRCSTAFQTQYREEFVRSFEHHQSLMRSVLTEEGVVKLPASFITREG